MTIAVDMGRKATKTNKTTELSGCYITISHLGKYDRRNILLILCLICDLCDIPSGHLLRITSVDHGCIHVVDIATLEFLSWSWLCVWIGAVIFLTVSTKDP